MILLLGYGNPLRTDDGIGRILARMLLQRLNRDDLEAQVLYQLTPEVVTRIAEASFVVFLDARMGEQAGKIIFETVYPEANHGSFTHNASPAALLCAAKDWYGATPHGLLISVTGASFDYGDQLSPDMMPLLPAIVAEIEQLIQPYILAIR